MAPTERRTGKLIAFDSACPALGTPRVVFQVGVSLETLKTWVGLYRSLDIDALHDRRSRRKAPA